MRAISRFRRPPERLPVIQEFLDAARAWGRADGDEEALDIVFYVQFAIGSGGRAWVGGIDPETVPADERKHLTMGQIHGRPTFEQMAERLDELIDDGIAPQFLVPALVAHVDDWLEHNSEDYAKGLANQRKFAATLREWADHGRPPELDDVREELGLPPAPQSTPDELRDMATQVEMRAVTTPAELRQRRRQLVSWRELTAPLVTRERLDRVWDEQLRRRRSA